MHEIGPGTLFVASKKPPPCPHVKQVPLHLRAPHSIGQQRDGPFEDIQAWDTRRFLGTLVQELHPDANTEERSSRGGCVKGRSPEPAKGKSLATTAKIPDPGQHYAIGCCDLG